MCAAQSDDDNFRANYYVKMGVRCATKHRSLDAVLSETPIDLAKLQRYCRLEDVSGTHRAHVWRLLLRVQPPDPAVNEFVASCGQQLLDDTLHCLQLLGFPAAAVDLTPHSCWLGWQLNSRQLLDDPPATSCAYTNDAEMPQLLVAGIVFDLMLEPVQRFGVLCRLWQLQREVLQQLDAHAARLTGLLTREDPELADHLRAIGFLEDVVCSADAMRPHVQAFFLNTLPKSTVEKLLDKLLVDAGLLCVLTFTSLLVTRRDSLLTCRDPDSVSPVLGQVTGNSSDRAAANLALHLWNSYTRV